MKNYRIYQVDAFTKERFRGNPAGVVPNADGLTDRQMQQIARELNNSETAFVFVSDDAAYDVELRFFTPRMEVPICGHATIAAHYVRAVEGAMQAGRVIQKTKAGLLPVDIAPKNGDYSVIMTQGRPEVGTPLDPASVGRIAQALGISLEDIRADCPVVIASTGYPKFLIGLQSLERLHALKPDMQALSALSAEMGCNGYYAFTLHPDEKALVHGRMFAPAVGIDEDPVTGNANGPLGAYLVHYGLFRQLERDGHLVFDIVQGEAIGREGGMRVSVDIEDGKPVGVRVRGQAVVVFRTDMAL